MFTPKKIENALVKLFDLFDAEVMENLYENYDEEIEDISPKWLAKAFTENASTIPEFRMVCRAGDGIDYNGRVLFKHRGVILLSYPESIIENDRMRTVTFTELWFLEDMTFAVVQYAGTMTKNGEDADCIAEYRRHVKIIRSEEDVFFEPEGQIYDILAGDFLITGLTEDDFGSLTPEQMQKFEKMFHQPEMFVKMGRSLMALPVPDDRVKKPDAPEKTDMTPKKSAPDRDVL